ncbi:hypothetical protein GCM10009853_032220 [Glycomyces scopariae]
MKETRNTAYIYPEPDFGKYDPEWVKALLLFFDDIAILAPWTPMLLDQIVAPIHRSLSQPLLDEGLLHVLDPSEFVDPPMVEQMAAIMVELITTGAFDAFDRKLASQRGLNPQGFISKVRFGYDAAPSLAQMVHDELIERGLAAPANGNRFAIDPAVRVIVLVLLAQLARAAGQRRGFNLHPSTCAPSVHHALNRVLNLPAMPSQGNVASIDVGTIAIDLRAVPLEDIIGFRKSNSRQSRAAGHYGRQPRAQKLAGRTGVVPGPPWPK